MPSKGHAGDIFPLHPEQLLSTSVLQKQRTLSSSKLRPDLLAWTQLVVCHVTPVNVSALHRGTLPDFFLMVLLLHAQERSLFWWFQLRCFIGG